MQIPFCSPSLICYHLCLTLAAQWQGYGERGQVKGFEAK
jgi:hypothetical protein